MNAILSSNLSVGVLFMTQHKEALKLEPADVCS